MLLEYKVLHLHRAAQAVLRTVVPHHREAEFLCQCRGGIVLRHHRHLREFLRRHRLQRTAHTLYFSPYRNP